MDNMTHTTCKCKLCGWRPWSATGCSSSPSTSSPSASSRRRCSHLS